MNHDSKHNIFLSAAIGCRTSSSTLNIGVAMSDKFVAYLKREHARLESELDRANRQRVPDQMAIARLKKLKLAIEDQITRHERSVRHDRAA